MKTKHRRDAALAKAIKLADGPQKLAKLIQEATGEPITQQAVSQWKTCPYSRVLVVERVTGVSRHELRPDIYPIEQAA